MNTTTYRAGDALIWKRADGPVRARVLAIKGHPLGGYPVAQIAVDGWLGTRWEVLGADFEPDAGVPLPKQGRRS